MPFLTVYTNATKINQKNFVEEISDLVAGELHKPDFVRGCQPAGQPSDGFRRREQQIAGALLEMKSIGFRRQKRVGGSADQICDGCNRR